MHSTSVRLARIALRLRPSSATVVQLPRQRRSLSSAATAGLDDSYDYSPYDPVRSMMEQANVDILSSPEVQKILADQRRSHEQQPKQDDSDLSFHHPAACGSPDPYLSDCEEMVSSWNRQQTMDDCDSLDAKRML